MNFGTFLLGNFERIFSDIAFFGQSLECQRRYERANAMLDDCLEIVWKWLQEKDLLNE